MRWECPFRESRRRQCRLFDGPCEPHAEGCLLVDAEADDEKDEEPLRRAVPPATSARWPALRARQMKT